MDDPSEILQEAREALQARDFPLALEKYEYFFDHSLDDDPYSMYGVRLSYCLDEWASIGKEYPEALKRLETRREETLVTFETDQDPQRFHEYMAFCRSLKDMDLPVEKFVKYDKENQELANICAHFIWDDLVERNLWELAAKYLNDTEQKYEWIIVKFDEVLKMAKEDPVNGGERIESQAKDWYVKDVSNVLSALKHTNRNDEFINFKGKAFQDLEARGFEEMKDRIENAIAL